MRKTSLKDATSQFVRAVDNALEFVRVTSSSASAKQSTMIHDHAIIVIFREFEKLMLRAISGAINNDSAALSKALDVKFPKHLAQPVCEFVVTRGGYFALRDRDSLLKEMGRLLGNTHWLVEIVKTDGYQTTLNRLIALRNLAAHDSEPARNRAKKSLNCQRLASAGTWLKRRNRLDEIATSLKKLAGDIASHAHY